MLNSQSRTVRAAYAEYERRYGRKPPLHFDKWFRAAQKDGFILVDEFDSMMANLEPLWGVAPSDIRARLENVIAASNGEGMYRFTVTRGSKPEFQDPADWMGGVFGNFLDDEVLQTLPELTLAMNTMDEPKVVVPHDILSNALRTAANTLSDPPPGRNPAITQNVDFLSMGKQNTWDAISLSCPPDSMARDFSAKAAQTPFLTDMGFLSNVTLSKDVCQFPELYSMHAGLRHPESMTITHALVPVFSQAKASCFNDLLYPSPFYAEKLRTGEYKESQDPDWGEKENIVYWTGSNTGGHSTSENWRDLQRQRLGLLILDKNRPVNLLSQIQQPNARKEWVSINSTIAAIANLTRIRISAAIQCDYMACQEQNEELEINPDVRDSITDGYHARYNIDLDGNGLSGRFYRLMMSKSAVLKQTLYQEWHDDYLIPWVHYIPLSFDLRDFPEIVRFLTEEPEGQTLGRNVAQQSYDWSRRALRLKDMRIFWWRLMLEYGRLVNDDRDQRTSK
ncbi:hypothetical protein N7488_008970 [Penicillium malachiteum]|nr:hypothetical protein N7488_008970 [Penicillium malachiteum]